MLTRAEIDEIYSDAPQSADRSWRLECVHRAIEKTLAMVDRELEHWWLIRWMWTYPKISKVTDRLLRESRALLDANDLDFKMRMRLRRNDSFLT